MAIGCIQVVQGGMTMAISEFCICTRLQGRLDFIWAVPISKQHQRGNAIAILGVDVGSRTSQILVEIAEERCGHQDRVAVWRNAPGARSGPKKYIDCVGERRSAAGIHLVYQRACGKKSAHFGDIRK